MTHYICQFQSEKVNVQNHEAFLFVIEHVIEMVTAVLKRNVATSPAVAIEPASVLVGVYSGGFQWGTRNVLKFQTLFALCIMFFNP